MSCPKIALFPSLVAVISDSLDFIVAIDLAPGVERVRTFMNTLTLMVLLSIAQPRFNIQTRWDQAKTFA